jgi:hypothetical protein
MLRPFARNCAISRGHASIPRYRFGSSATRDDLRIVVEARIAARPGEPAAVIGARGCMPRLRTRREQ